MFTISARSLKERERSVCSSSHQIVKVFNEVLSIPQVTIKTGLRAPDGHEEVLTEYFCDHPGCPNIATHALGCVVELCVVTAMCDEHAPKPRK
jgi:hypothetical protein